MEAAAAQSLRDRAAGVLAQAAGAPMPSPCTSVCRMNEDSGLCAGCLRTIDEIAAWSTLDRAARRGVWAQIAQRARQFSNGGPGP